MVTGPAGTTVTFPPDVVTENAELHTEAPAPGASAAPPPPGHHRYEASVFALGSAAVPPIAIAYRLPEGTSGTVSTAPITVKVVTLLPKDAKEPTLADIRPPIALGISPLFWVALGLLALLLAALVWRWWRRRRPRAALAPEVPSAAPPVEANAALDALAAADLVRRGELRTFYIRLVDIARRYLERRLGAPVMEMTSAEAVAFLFDHPQATALAPVLRDVAGAADQVKFARGEGVAAEAERHLAAVRGLVAGLEERLAPPPPQEQEQVA
jgi:hypothetical protein